MAENPVIIVTGASRGLGAAIARQAAEMGAHVALAARSFEQLEELAKQITKGGGEALAVQVDVGDEADCRFLINKTVERFGRIDALVHNAGIVEPIDPIAQADFRAWERLARVNFLGVVMLTQMALPYLRPARGRVVNITSGAAVRPVAGWGAYSTSKAAINQITRVLASEEPDVTAVAVLPGIVDTEMQVAIRTKGKGHMAEQNYEMLSGLHARGELLPPDTPGRAIASLALFAPHEWSGEIMTWNDPRLQELVGAHSPK